MSSKPAKTAKPGQKPAANTETRQSIANKTEEFLRAGGQIQQIARGVSGQERLMGTKSRVISPASKP